MYSLFSYKEFMTPSKGWKLEALSDQFLNRDIDNVGQIVAGPRGLQAGLDDYLPGSLTLAVTSRNSRITYVGGGEGKPLNSYEARANAEKSTVIYLLNVLGRSEGQAIVKDAIGLIIKDEEKTPECHSARRYPSRRGEPPIAPVLPKQPRHRDPDKGQSAWSRG